MAIKSLTLGEIIYLKCAAENSPSSCHLANLRDGSEPPRPTRCSFKHFSKLMSIRNSTNSSLKWKAVVKRAISLTLGNNTYVYIWNSFWHAGVAEVLENVTNNRCSRTETDAKMRIISAKRRAEIYVGGEHILPAEHLLLWQRTLPASQRASDEETQTDHTPTWCKFSPPAESSVDYCLSLITTHRAAQQSSRLLLICLWWSMFHSALLIVALIHLELQQVKLFSLR